MFSRRAIYLVGLIALSLVDRNAGAGRGNAIYPEDYGAVGDGSADDSRPVAAGCLASSTMGVPLLFRQKYRFAGSTSLRCSTAYEAGALLLPDRDITVTLLAAINASQEQQIFGGNGSASALSAPYVSVAWWGATASAPDSAPAFQAAGGSNRVILVPPLSNCYLFNSTPNQPYPTLNPTSVWWKGFTNFKVEGYGACIKEGTAVTHLYNMILFDQDSNFVVDGLQFVGDQNANWVTPTTIQNSAISMMSLVNATFRDLKFPGNWGGVGNPFVGDYIVDSVFENLNMPSVGLCFDLAFLLRARFNKVNAIGSDGSTGKGMKCFSIIYDDRNLGLNKTGHTIVDTSGVRITDSGISNFENPLIVSSGEMYYFSGNRWHNNPTVGVQKPAASVLFYYFNGEPYSSVGHPVHHVTIDRDVFRNNGGAAGVFALGIGAAAITNSDVMREFIVSNSLFDNNTDTAIGVDTTNHLSNIDIKGSNQFLGEKQANVLRLGMTLEITR